MTPPKLPRRLLERVLPPEDRGAVIGDLDEEYRRHVAPARGARRAALWYWRQAILSFPSAMTLRSRARRGRSPGARRPRIREALAAFLTDVHDAARLARRNAGFTAAAVATHALAVAVTTAVVTLGYIVLLRPLPYAAPDRLVHLAETSEARPGTSGNFSYPDFAAIRSDARVFESMAGYSGGSRTLTVSGTAARVPMTEVSDGFFEMLGVAPLAGRTFDERDVEPGAPAVTILSHGTWLRRFGGSADILGQAIPLNGVPHRVIGVMPRGFEFALRGMTEVWLPLRPSRAQLERRYYHWLGVIARVRAGATDGEVRDALAALAREAAGEDPRYHAGRAIVAVPLRDRMVGDMRAPLVALLAAVGLVLLGSCVSVAGLHVARWNARAQEVGLRAAIGAGRFRLGRQFLLESLLPAVCAAALGLAAGSWLLQLFVASLPAQHRTALPHHDALALDLTTAVLAVAVSLLTAVAAGVIPAVRAARVDPVALLRASGRIMAVAGGGRTRAMLVGAQVAFAAALMAGAALLGRSTWQVLQVSPGFDTGRLLTMRINLPDQGYESAAAVRAFQARLLRRLMAVPGVEGTATISQLPLTGRGNSGTFVFDAEPAGEADRAAAIRTVSLEYFDVMGVPLREGRALGPADRDASPPVVLVNETFARSYGDGGVLGRRIVFEFFTGRPHWEIVGIVGDERFESLDRAPLPVVYFPFAQDTGGAFSVVLRTSGDPGRWAAAARAAVTELDPELPAFHVRSMAQIVAESDAVFLRQQVLVLLAVFGIAALIVSATGVYAVLAHLVAQQRAEIGLRRALGATGGEIAALVIARGAAPAVAGLCVGLALAVAAARALDALLFEVSPADPLSLLAVAAALLTAVLAACLVPARRALRVDPAIALRQA